MFLDMQGKLSSTSILVNKISAVHFRPGKRHEYLCSTGRKCKIKNGVPKFMRVDSTYWVCAAVVIYVIGLERPIILNYKSNEVAKQSLEYIKQQLINQEIAE